MKHKVTKKSLANLKKIKKGQVLNPLGGNAHNVELRKVRALTKDQLAEVGSLLVQQNLAALLNIVDRPHEFSALQVYYAQTIINCSRRGDAYMMNCLLDRIVGKPVETLILEKENESPTRLWLPDNETG